MRHCKNSELLMRADLTCLMLTSLLLTKFQFFYFFFQYTDLLLIIYLDSCLHRQQLELLQENSPVHHMPKALPNAPVVFRHNIHPPSLFFSRWLLIINYEYRRYLWIIYCDSENPVKKCRTSGLDFPWGVVYSVLLLIGTSAIIVLFYICEISKICKT
jgi:hypothetical protein